MKTVLIKNYYYKSFAIIIATFFINNVYGQSNYKWKATLEDSVGKDGFYNIALSPEIGAQLQDNYSDIRIVDENNYQVPFIQKTEEPHFTESRFKEYPIVSKEIVENCCTKLTIKNTDKKAINNICLILKNSNAVKVTRIVGSDDGTNWYGIQSFDIFYNQYSETDTKVVNYIHFPLTDYLYYRLEIIDRGYWDEDRWAYWYQDRWSYPVNILKVGYYESFIKEGKYAKTPTPSFTKLDSTDRRKTYFKINLNDDYTINRIRFSMKGPRYYKRKAALALMYTDKRTKKTYYEPQYYIELNSYSLNEFNFDRLREKEFYLIIENEDSRPLEIEGVEAWQLTRYLKTYLEKGHQYSLIYGDSLAEAPVYDLRFFADSIPEILPTIPITSITAAEKKNPNVREEKAARWFENKLYIWLAIGCVTLLLFFMSWKMLNEMKKGK